MADLQVLYSQAKKSILTIRAGVERLEALESGARGGAPSGLLTDLQHQLTQLQRCSQDLDACWRMQTLREAANKIDVWKRKVEQVAEEADALAVAVSRLGAKAHRRQIDEQQRQELLQRRADGGIGNSNIIAEMDADAVAKRRVDNSRRVLEEAYETGVGVLGAMSGNRERLKATHRKVLDVLNSTGLGDSLLRLIEKRQNMDMLLTYGGMVGVLVFVAVLYWWFKM
jgi:golgi SNAP receptor complex member 2